jgi:hypothetical protein
MKLYDYLERVIDEKKTKPIKKSKCCGAKVVFNNATGDEVCSACKGRIGKGDSYMSEAMQLVFSGKHLKDNILDDISVEELQEMIESNIPLEKLSVQSAMKEFDTLIKMKLRDAKSIVKKVVPELVKDIINRNEAEVKGMLRR